METHERRDRVRIGGRRPRMSEAQTRQTALHTAVMAIREHGLPLGLEYLSMEDVIREAEVSRTTFYRLWPQKEQFTGDLIVELAKEAIPIRNTRGEAVTSQLRDQLLSHLDELRDPDARWRLVTDLLVSASTPDFEHTSSLAGQWRTYFALASLTMNLPDGEVKDATQKEISNSENLYRERLTMNFALLTRLFGIRVRPQSGATLDNVADLVIAMVRGLVLRDRAANAPLSTNLVSLGAASILTHCFENDPATVWDESRITWIKETLTSKSNLF